MQNLLIVSIGPVQDFIAAARRSRDLWFGSWLLSELSKEAALSLSKQGGELVFPSPQEEDKDLKPGSDFSVANKITAIIDGEPARIASEVEVRVRRRLRDLMQEAFKAVKGEFYKEKAEEQVEDMLEIFAASVPMGDYKDALEKANSLLAARKNTRDFQPVTWGAPVPKSSLDGQRESVIPEEKYDELSPENLRKKYGVAPSERLCGVGLLKRHGAKSEQKGFFSTSHVAALSLAEAFKPEHKKAFDDYISKLKSLGVEDDLNSVSVEHEVFGRYDLHILFEERLHEFLEKEQLSKAKKSLGDFLKSTVNKKPIPYYAILQADGDRMGELLDKESTKEMHQKISKRLSSFAENAGEIVSKYRGSLIYAGGDDVLAMLPLHTVLKCVNKLAEEFAKRLQDLSSIKPSLSAGIAVCHHIDPMYEALRLVRSAEKIAKSVDGKDALAITVSKRSGVDVTVKGKRKDLVKRLKKLINYHVLDKIPDGFAYELRTLKSQFKEFKERSKSSERSEFSEEIIKYEAIRILGRKRRKRGSEDVDVGVQEYLRQYVEQDLELELIVARLFAEAYELACGKGKSNVLGD